jgi:hypothetical protein
MDGVVRIRRGQVRRLVSGVVRWVPLVRCPWSVVHAWVLILMPGSVRRALSFRPWAFPSCLRSTWALSLRPGDYCSRPVAYRSTWALSLRTAAILPSGAPTPSCMLVPVHTFAHLFLDLRLILPFCQCVPIPFLHMHHKPFLVL